MDGRAKRKAGNSFGPGHPWYYVMGGKPPYPRQIMEEAKRRSYRGYLAADIDRADALPEPKRSHALRAIRAKVLADYRANLSIYRETVRDLACHRATGEPPEAPACEAVHSNVCLKNNHLFNDLAHLRILAELLDRQPDLFGF